MHIVVLNEIEFLLNVINVLREESSLPDFLDLLEDVSEGGLEARQVLFFALASRMTARVD